MSIFLIIKNRCVKALDRKAGRLCILADDCDQEQYKKLVIALCEEHQVPHINVKSREQLGQWCGLTKKDESGNPRKTVKTSCCVITDYGEESAALSFVLGAIKA